MLEAVGKGLNVEFDTDFYKKKPKKTPKGVSFFNSVFKEMNGWLMQQPQRW